MHILGQSTKVTEHNAPPKRLPTYWFRIAAPVFPRGVRPLGYAMAVDVAAIVAHALGTIKRVLQRRRDRCGSALYRRLNTTQRVVAK